MTLHLIRIALLTCVLAVLVASNLFILPGVIALGYIVCLLAVITLTYF